MEDWTEISVSHSHVVYGVVRTVNRIVARFNGLTKTGKGVETPC